MPPPWLPPPVAATAPAPSSGREEFGTPVRWPSRASSQTGAAGSDSSDADDERDEEDLADGQDTPVRAPAPSRFAPGTPLDRPPTGYASSGASTGSSTPAAAGPPWQGAERLFAVSEAVPIPHSPGSALIAHLRHMEAIQSHSASPAEPELFPGSPSSQGSSLGRRRRTFVLLSVLSARVQPLTCEMHVACAHAHTDLLDAVHIVPDQAGELHAKLARRMSISEQVVRFVGRQSWAVRALDANRH